MTDSEKVSTDNFQVMGNVLLANVDLCWENHAEFRECCQQLTTTPSQEIILDLTNVSFVFSAYMGTIGEMLTQAAQTKKKLTIRISESIYWLFEIAGFEQIVTVEVVH